MKFEYPVAVVSPPRRQRATLYQRLDCLRHIERLSTRFTKQPAREAGDLRRLAHAERARERLVVTAFDTQRFDKLLGLAHAERTKSDARDGCIALDATQPLGERGIGSDCFGPHVQQQQDRHTELSPPARDIVQDILRSGIRPLDIVDEQHDRSTRLCRERLAQASHRFEESNPRPCFIAACQQQVRVAFGEFG